MIELEPGSEPEKIDIGVRAIKVKSPNQKGSFGVTFLAGGGTTPYQLTPNEEKEIDLKKNGAEITNTGKSTLEIREVI